MERTWVKTLRPGEAFWCEVVGEFGKNAIIVRVDSDLVSTELHGLKRGDEFVLKKSDIKDVMKVID